MMKGILTLTTCLLLCVAGSAQTSQDEIRNDHQQKDSISSVRREALITRIQDIDKNYASAEKDEWELNYMTFLTSIDNLLFDEIRIGDLQRDLDSIYYFIDYIVHPITLMDMEYEVSLYIELMHERDMTDERVLPIKDSMEKSFHSFVESKVQTKVYSSHRLNEVRNYIIGRIEFLASMRNPYLSYSAAKPKVLKGVSVFLDNDSFTSLLISNFDRDYTGGGQFALQTDLFKLRFFPTTRFCLAKERKRGWLRSRQFFGYQEVFYGTEGYTPNIRDTSIFSAPDVFDPADRPFASFQYFGRRKHRIHYTKVYRTTSEIRIGVIGGSVANSIQSFVHRDLTVASVTPNGWQTQIANGGRMGLQVMKRFERNLSERWLNSTQVWHPTFSAHCTAEIGNFVSYIEPGLKLATFDLEGAKQYGIHRDKGFGNRLFASIEYGYRFVGWDSSLQGYGFFGHSIDEDPTSPVDVHVLDRNQIQQHYSNLIVTVGYSSEMCDLVLRFNRLGQQFSDSFIDADKNMRPFHVFGTVLLAYRLVGR